MTGDRGAALRAEAAGGPPGRLAGLARPERRALRAWTVTLAATAASTYALDLVAAAAGIGLVASGLVAEVGRAGTVLFLVVSYAVWGQALRTNLRANRSLLESTGTSTNALSKAAFELTRRRTSSVRAPRLAAAVGYVGTEVAKEVPYYAGAFGAAFVSDSVSQAEALVFLGGANLGAALYEFGLARLSNAVTRGVLRRRRRYASFDTGWEPGE